jgi:HSP20 family protein
MSTNNNADGILGNLTKLLNAVQDLAEKGHDMKRSGVFDTDEGKKVNFSYGVNFRSAGDGSNDVCVEPFGNVVDDDDQGRPTVSDLREPITDVFEEDDAVVIVAEMPGLGEGDIQTAIDGATCTIRGEKHTKRYEKTLELPRTFDTAAAQVECNNGVVEIRLTESTGNTDAA